MKKISFLLTVIIAGLLINACVKDDLENLSDVDYQVLAEDSNTSQLMFDDLFKVVDEEAKNGEKADTLSGKTAFSRKAANGDTCAVVTIDIDGAAIFPLTLTIDFGTGCTAVNTNLGTSVTRRGTVTAVFTGLYTEAGSRVTVTTNEYYVNDHKVEGTKTILNEGLNANGNLVFSVIDNNGLITKPDGGTITWQSERTNEWVAGAGTNVITDGISGICDDVYLIKKDGYSQGTVSDGTSYRLDILEDLEKELCCRRLTDGVLQYTVNGSVLGTIDYETDECTDAWADVEILENQFVIRVQ